MSSFGRIKKDVWGNIVIIDEKKYVCGFGCRRDAKDKTYLFWEENIGRDCEFRIIDSSNGLKQYKGLYCSIIVSFLDEYDYAPGMKRVASPIPREISRIRSLSPLPEKEEIEDLKVKASRVDAIEIHLRSLQNEYTETMLENEKNKSKIIVLQETLDEIRGLSTSFN
jgi:hypothetical protein